MTNIIRHYDKTRQIGRPTDRATRLYHNNSIIRVFQHYNTQCRQSVQLL